MFDLAFLSVPFMGEPLWMWLTFSAVVIGILVFDLGVMNKNEHEIDVKESLGLSAFYIAIGLLFGGWIWFELGSVKAAEYFTGFVIEAIRKIVFNCIGLSTSINPYFSKWTTSPCRATIVIIPGSLFSSI